jgi:hypothetical protein
MLRYRDNGEAAPSLAGNEGSISLMRAGREIGQGKWIAAGL